MKMDNVVNSVVNIVNTPVAAPVSGNTASSRKAVDTVEPEKNEEKNTDQPEKLDKEKLNKAINVANEAFKEVDIGFKYYFNKKLNCEVVEIVNIETGEKIRQYPPEEIINMLERMYDMLGLLIDKKA